MEQLSKSQIKLFLILLFFCFPSLFHGQLCNKATFLDTDVELGSSPLRLNAQRIQNKLCIRVKSIQPVAWMAFGFSTTGFMVSTPNKNCIFMKDERPELRVISSKSSSGFAVQQDQSSLNDNLISSSNIEGKMEFVYERELTASSQSDVAINQDGPNNVIWAYGNAGTSFPISNHGTGSRGSESINFYTLASTTIDTYMKIPTAPIAIAFVLILCLLGLLVTKTPLSKSSFGRLMLHTTIGVQPKNKEIHKPFIDFIPNFLDLLFGELLVIILYIISLVVVALVVNNEISEFETDTRVKWALITGHLAAFNLMCVLLTVSRVGVWKWAFGITFERMVKFHRWISRMLLATTLAHLILSIDSCDVFSSNDCGSQSVNPLMGFLAFICFESMGILAFEPIRRNLFELFYYYHRVSSIAGLIFVMIHSRANQFVMILPLVFYGLGYIFRLRAYKNETVVEFHRKTGDILFFELAENDITRKWTTSMNPGTYFLVNIPSLSRVEWHPFSAIVSPLKNTFGFAIRDSGSYTKNLISASSINKTSLKLEGPYGSLSFKPRDLQLLVLVGGGIGITPLLSIINMQASNEELKHIPKIILIWTVRKADELLCCEDYMFPRNSGSTSTDKVECEVIHKFFVSSAESGGELSTQTSQSVSYAPGRPNLLELVSVMDISGRTGMVACGPEALVDSAQKTARSCGFLFHKERFLW